MPGSVGRGLVGKAGSNTDEAPRAVVAHAPKDARRRRGARAVRRGRSRRERDDTTPVIRFWGRRPRRRAPHFGYKRETDLVSETARISPVHHGRNWFKSALSCSLTFWVSVVAQACVGARE